MHAVAPARSVSVQGTAEATLEGHCASPSAVDSVHVAAETPGLRCCAYLHVPAGATASHVAWAQSGTGLYSTANGDVGGIAPIARRASGVALLTIDKPGIELDPSNMRSLRIAPEEYRRHTIADLVTCSRHAIAWSMAHPTVSRDASLILYGHSEGAQTAARLLASSDPSMDRVELAIIGGLLMEPMAVAIDRQLGIFLPFEIESFRRALADRDDALLLQYGFSWRYFEHPTAREPLDGVLHDVARRRPGLRIHALHGDRDLNAPLRFVTSFVDETRRALHDGRPALDLHLHVYKGAAHDLGSRADADLEALLGSLLRRSDRTVQSRGGSAARGSGNEHSAR